MFYDVLRDVLFYDIIRYVDAEVKFFIFISASLIMRLLDNKKLLGISETKIRKSFIMFKKICVVNGHIEHEINGKMF